MSLALIRSEWTMGDATEEHGSESYSVLGGGLLAESVGGRESSLAAAVEDQAPQFRFSRVRRCFDLDPERFDAGSIRNNVNLTYGSSGFAFAEPGTYEVTALLAVPDRRRERDLILRSETLPLRVATPKAIGGRGRHEPVPRRRRRLSGAWRQP